MGARGPARIPTKLKIERGNPGHQKLNKNEPVPERGRPDPPHWMGDAARREFGIACDELDKMGLLFKADAGVIACYAQALADIAESTATLEVEGKYLGSDDRKFIHPAENVRREAMRSVRQLARELGFSPSARSGIVAKTPSDVDDLDDFVKSKGSKLKVVNGQ